jgi:hypothetical protein
MSVLTKEQCRVPAGQPEAGQYAPCGGGALGAVEHYSQGHAQALHTIQTSLGGSNPLGYGISQQTRDLYEQAARRVLDAMSPQAAQDVAHSLTGVHWYASSADLTTQMRKEGTDVPMGSVTMGAFHTGTGVASLDGMLWQELPVALGAAQQNVYGTYAHELTHAIDKSGRYSSTPEWQQCWQKEIVGDRWQQAPLTEYARNAGKEEGFAEFGRLLYGSEADLGQAEKLFPQCFAFFRSKGLFTGHHGKAGVTCVTPGTPLLPELFSGGGLFHGQYVDWSDSPGSKTCKETLGVGLVTRAVEAQLSFTGEPQLLPLVTATQPNHYYCGACAAFEVAQYYGVGEQTLKATAQRLGTDEEKSTRPQAIVKYLTAEGLDVDARAGLTLDDLRRAWLEGKPVICPVQDYGPSLPSRAVFAYGHYLVVIGVALGHVFCADSSEDNVTEGSGTIADEGRVMIREDVWLDNWHDKDIDGNKYIHYGIIVGSGATSEASGTMPSKSKKGSPEQARVPAGQPGGGQFTSGGGEGSGESKPPIHDTPVPAIHDTPSPSHPGASHIETMGWWPQHPNPTREEIQAANANWNKASLVGKAGILLTNAEHAMVHYAAGLGHVASKATEVAATAVLGKEWGTRVADKLSGATKSAVLGAVKVTFLSFKVGQEYAKEAARISGVPEHKLAGLGRSLMGADVLLCKAAVTACEMLHVGTLGFTAAGFVPIASALYVGASLARRPVATVKAAGHIVDIVRRAWTDKKLFDALFANEALVRELAKVMAGPQGDWFSAILAQSVDQCQGDLALALRLALMAFVQYPEPTQKVDSAGLDGDNKGYNPDQPRVPAGQSGGGQWGGGTGAEKIESSHVEQGTSEHLSEYAYGAAGWYQVELRLGKHPGEPGPDGTPMVDVYRWEAHTPHGETPVQGEWTFNRREAIDQGNAYADSHKWDGSVEDESNVDNVVRSEHIDDWNENLNSSESDLHVVHMEKGEYNPHPELTDSVPATVYRWVSVDEWGSQDDQGGWTPVRVDALIDGQRYAGSRHEEPEEKPTDEDDDEGPKASTLVEQKALDKIKDDLRPERALALVGADIPELDGAQVDVGDEVSHQSDTDGYGVKLSVSHDDLVGMQRTLGVDTNGEKYIHNDYFVAGQEGTGLGLKVFSNEVKTATEYGYSYIATYGAGKFMGNMNGYYTWPRFGYNESMEDVKDEHPDLAQNIDRLFPHAKDILDLYGTKSVPLTPAEDKVIREKLADLDASLGRTRQRPTITGADWWQVHGSGLHNLRFDLTPGSKSQVALADYLAAQKQKKGGQGA